MSEGLETIGRNAFADCMKLESLFIPSTVNSIGVFAFANCRAISSIVVSDNNIVFDSHNNCNAIIKTSSNELIVGCKNTIIPRDVRSIGDNAFYGCYNLSKIVIPDQIYKIGQDAFSGCANLKTINLPDNTSFLGNYAFYGCSSLTSITLPPNVSYGKYTFRDTGLTKIIVGATQPKSLNGEEFNKTNQMTLYVPLGCKSKYESATYWRNFKEIVELSDDTFIPYGDMTMKIIDGTEKKSIVYSAVSQPSYTIVPSSVSGYKVIGIDEEAFEDEDGIESISIPSSIEYIGEGAFKRCDISKVIISDIEAWCNISIYNSYSNPLTYADLYLRSQYSNNDNLVQDLYIPSNVNVISDYAFYCCSSLISVYIPKEVNSIGSYTFYGCPNLKSVTINNPTPPQLANYSLYNYNNVILYVPYGSIKAYETAGYSNFFKEIKSIPLNNGDIFVEKTKEGVEMKLCVISNDDKTCSVGRGYVGYNDDTPEPYCINPEYEGEVTIPAFANGYSVIEIADNAFTSTNGMKVKAVNIPDGVITIGRNAFKNCKSLSAIELPNSITSIYDYAFSGCENLESVILPKLITRIPNYIFQGCNSLSTIFIPNTVQTIGWNAFDGCSSLATFTIPESVWIVGINAFTGTTWYNNLPDGLIYKDNIILGYKGNQPTGSLEIAHNTRLVGEYAFENCKGITSVIIHDPVKQIAYGAFEGCSGIMTVELPITMNSILLEAFSGCNNLVSISFPKTIEQIGAYAFNGCNISKVFIERPEPIELYSNVFSNTNATLYVPEGSKSLYEVAEGWKDFKEIIEQKVEATEVDKIYCNRLEINKGNTVEAIIQISEESLINAFEFDLKLPDGVTVAEDEGGNYLISKVDLLKDNSWTVLISEMENNTYHFKCYTTTKGNIILRKWGDLLAITLKTTENMLEGVFNATIKNVILKVSDDKLLKAEDYTFVIEMTDIIKGNVNGDDCIDMVDVVSIINYILGNVSDSFKKRAADLNDDGDVDIFDVMLAINLALTNKSVARSMARAMINADEFAVVTPTVDGIMLAINDPVRFTAFQFDVEVADGVELTNARLIEDTSHTLQFIKIDENIYRVIGVSMNNRTLSANEDGLLGLSFSKSGHVQINNIIFVTPQETTVRFACGDAVVNRIGSMEVRRSEEIFDLSGRKVGTDRSHLPKGVYIINNKKVVIK